MSNSGQAPRCPFCNCEMRLGISKTDRSRGRRFWKCTRSYGTLYCAGFIWDDESNRFNQASRENEAVRGGEGINGFLEDELQKPKRLQDSIVNSLNGIRDLLLFICGFVVLISALLIMIVVMKLVKK